MNIFLQQKTYHSINQLIIVLIIHQSINQLKVQSFKIHLSLNTLSVSISNSYSISPEMEFKEFEPRFKSAKTRFKLSAGLNLGTFDTILSGTNHI